jgi:hypothetical protein
MEEKKPDSNAQHVQAPVEVFGYSMTDLIRLDTYDLLHLVAIARKADDALDKLMAAAIARGKSQIEVAVIGLLASTQFKLDMLAIVAAARVVQQARENNQP